MKRLTLLVLFVVSSLVLARSAFAVVTTGSGGSGVTVGNSSLIGSLEYSDTFTGTPDGGANPSRPYIAALQPAAAYVVENTYGNPTQSWSNSFSFASDRAPGTPGFVNGVPAYPGSPGVNQNTSGSGSLTGFTQTGGTVDYGISASHANQFVVQFDAVQVNDRIDISTSNTPGTIFTSPSLSVFFRKTGAANEIGLYNGTTETPTGLTSGAALGTWNNYAVKFDRVAGTVQFFTNEVSRGTINLNTFAGGIYANFGTTAVSVGAGLAGGENRTWTDNVQIGRPVGSPPNPAYPSSLISYWTFNEAASGSSMAFDAQHANNGTALHTTGLIGTGAAAINGSLANSVNVGAGGGNNFFTPNGITFVSAFTIPASYTGATEGEFFRKEDANNRILVSFQSGANINNASGQLVGTSGVPGISFGLNTGGYKEMDVALDGLGGRPTLASLADGKTHFLAVSYDAATGIKKMMLDGNIIALIDGADNVLVTDGGAAAAFIGSSGGGSEPFPGVLDSTAVFNAALSDRLLQTYSTLARAGLDPLALPEPGTWSLGSLVLLVGFGYAWKRRRNVVAA